MCIWRDITRKDTINHLASYFVVLNQAKCDLLGNKWWLNMIWPGNYRLGAPEDIFHWIPTFDGKTNSGLEHEFYDFPFSWEFHHPNWRTHILEKGRYTTNQHHISCEKLPFWRYTQFSDIRILIYIYMSDGCHHDPFFVEPFCGGKAHCIRWYSRNYHIFGWLYLTTNIRWFVAPYTVMAQLTVINGMLNNS